MRERRDRRLRGVLVASGFLLCLLVQVREGLVEEPGVTDFYLAVALGVVVVKFCCVDYRLHGGVFLRSFQWVTFFTWPLALPGYLLWSRGPRKGPLAILLGYAGMTATSVAASGISYAVWACRG